MSTPPFFVALPVFDSRIDRFGFMVIFAVEMYRRRMGFKRVAIANVRYAVDARTSLRRLRRADRRPRSRFDPTALSRNWVRLTHLSGHLSAGSPAERLTCAPHAVENNSEFSCHRDSGFALADAFGQLH